MKNNISKLVLVVFVVIFIIPFNVKAILTKETAPAVNTFTIAQPQTCTVTRNYYYIDETDNRTQAKVSTTNNVYCGNSITLNNGLMNLDYANVKWYIGNTELTGFWVGKFEPSHATSYTSTTSNYLGCSDENCSNADNIRNRHE